jgi:plasmid stability protein
VANLTIAIEDDVLKKARLRAVEQGTSVNAVVREFLRDYTGKRSRQADAAARLIELAHQSRAEVGPVTWTRDDIHDRESPHR